jgi:hypothetical protein
MTNKTKKKYNKIEMKGRKAGHHTSFLNSITFI